MSNEIVIVGAGLIGSSIAYHLSLITDQKVIVIERSQCSYPEYSSKGNARITGRVIGSECPEYISLLPLSNKVYQELIEQGFPIYYPGNCITIGEQNNPRITEILEQIQTYSVKAEQYKKDKLTVPYTDGFLTTSENIGEVIVEKCSNDNMLGLLDPSMCIKAFQTLAAKNGVEFRFSEKLISLSENNYHCCLETLSNDKNRRVFADTVILATNANSNYLSSLNGKVWRQRIPLIFIEVENKAFTSSYLYVNKSGCYDLFVMPERLNGKLYFKAGIHDLDLYENPELSDEKFLQKMKYIIYHKACEFFPFVRNKKISHTVMCEYGITQDGFPYIGQAAPNVWAAIGFNGNGAKHAGAFGLLMAQSLKNQKVDLMLKRFAVDRGTS